MIDVNLGAIFAAKRDFYLQTITGLLHPVSPITWLLQVEIFSESTGTASYL